MAGELWNRVHIPFPSAVSSVHLHLTSTTVTHAQSLLRENEKVLKLLNSELLQTEVRVLYELLHNLSNSFRGNKTFKSLKQVEQCINRLKNMKLDFALQELADVCSSKIRRQLSHSSADCDVPSQPMLEWTCLKVLGAAQLMSCTLNRCSSAFVLSKQQMKWEEFVLTNMVITSMLSRLWVIFRGVLLCLSSLYKHLLDLLRDVAQAKPMPFLTNFSLPEDMIHFLGPSVALLLHRLPHAKESKITNPPVKVKTRKIKDDLGVAIERGLLHDTDMKPFLKILKNSTKGNSFREESHKTEKKLQFRTQIGKAATFTLVARHLEEMIAWCRSQRMEKERQLYSFLRLKCQKMRCLEAAGYNVQKRLRAFRREVCRASSSCRTRAKTFHSFAAMRRNARRKIRFQSLRSQFMSSKLRTARKRKQPTRQRDGTDLSVSLLSTDNQRSRTTDETTHQTSDSGGNDDIDDIFASIGL